MILLSATDVISAVAATPAAINYAFEKDNTITGADVVSAGPKGQLPSSVGTIWAALAGNWFVYLMLTNSTGSPVSGIQLFMNGTSAADAITGTFTIPANGGAIYTGRSLRIYDNTGTPIK